MKVVKVLRIGLVEEVAPAGRQVERAVEIARFVERRPGRFGGS